MGEIRPHVGIRVFVEEERGRGVLQEKVQHTNSHGRQSGDLGRDLVRDQMEAPGSGLEEDGCLMPMQGIGQPSAA
jgi:hypothetical protein